LSIGTVHGTVAVASPVRVLARGGTKRWNEVCRHIALDRHGRDGHNGSKEESRGQELHDERVKGLIVVEVKVNKGALLSRSRAGESNTGEREVKE
jgi:hypothetical protein